MFKSIVVGTDGSATAREAVRQAADIARSTESRLHVVTAYQPVVERDRGGAGDPKPAEPEEEVKSVLREVSEELEASGVEVEIHARKGEPADALIEVAEEQAAGLIVVGNKGMTGAKRFLLGSVPDKVSHHAPCSVCIIRTT